MQGIELTGTPPWKTLYLHGLVRAADGQKMSKSKGNTVDPLGLIDQYGADALRFFMAAMESQGRDIKMDDARLAGYRNFATKLWNAARFCEFNGIGASTDIAAPARHARGQQVDHRRGRPDRDQDRNRARRLPLRRRRQRDLPFHLGPLLRLVSRADQGRDRRRNQGRRRLGVRPDPRHAPPLHALHHRGIVACDGRQNRRARSL